VGWIDNCRDKVAVRPETLYLATQFDDHLIWLLTGWQLNTVHAVTVVAPKFEEGSLTPLGITWRKRKLAIV
jgi:hypothetical protein